MSPAAGADDPRPRLIPLWWTVGVLTLLTLFTAAFALAGAFADGTMRWGGVLLAIACGATLLSASVALLTPRRRRRLDPSPDGVTEISSPAIVAHGLVVAWLALLGVAAVWTWVAVTDPAEIESPGLTLVTILAAVGTLPDLARLLTGRLHRWRLLLGPDGVTYRGYRTDMTIPWSQLHGAQIQRRKPAGVRLDRKGTGPDPVVPAVAFTLAPEQVVEELRSRVAQARRG